MTKKEIEIEVEKDRQIKAKASLMPKQVSDKDRAKRLQSKSKENFHINYIEYMEVYLIHAQGIEFHLQIIPQKDREY